MKLPILFRVILSFLVLGFILPAQAQRAFTSIEAYRLAEVTDAKPMLNKVYSLPLSKIQRAARGWEPELVKDIQGDLVSTIHSIGRSAHLDDVVAHYQNQLNTENHQVLFECVGRNCGPSNAWANNFFDDYRLYGADDNQTLLVLQHEYLYQVIYVNRRGAGDIMVRIDQILNNDDVNEFVFEAQFALTDTTKIRRFVEVNNTNRAFYAVISTQGTNPIVGFESAKTQTSNIQNVLGPRLSQSLEFINLGSSGIDKFGVNKITFIAKE